jgi:hypothetical protein
MSLPSFVHDVAWAFAEWVNEESYKFAATGKADYPLVAPEGGKEPLRAEYSAFTMGSDHDVYQDSSFGIPAIYLNDWPDRYIHTNFDSAANIDPTKLKRAAFLGAASGYFLSKMNASDGAHADDEVQRHWPWMMILYERLGSGDSGDAMTKAFARFEDCARASILAFDPAVSAIQDMQIPRCDSARKPPTLKQEQLEAGASLRFVRTTKTKGPLGVFGYDYFAEHSKSAGVATPKLLSHEGLWGGSEEYAYEVLNFADGKRNAQEIRDSVSAEYGPVPLEMVVEYLKALEKIGIVEGVK